MCLKYSILSISEFLVNLVTFFVWLQATDDNAASDARWRMEQTSYVQEQYTLTRCSLGSERGVFPSYSPPAECLSLGMDAASLPHSLERVQPQHSHSLTRWDTSWKENITSSMEEESEKVRKKVEESERMWHMGHCQEWVPFVPYHFKKKYFKCFDFARSTNISDSSSQHP